VPHFGHGMMLLGLFPLPLPFPFPFPLSTCFLCFTIGQTLSLLWRLPKIALDATQFPAYHTKQIVDLLAKRLDLSIPA
jgi:hypothetical protein